MSVKALTYYAVECDDCSTSTGDLDDYSAWAERWYAVEQWTDHDGFIAGDIALCHEHAPRCPHGYLQFEDEGDCEGCES
jgi:hypothetical protein